MKLSFRFCCFTVLFVSAVLIFPVLTANEQISIPQIDRMPNFPQPYHIRDWKKVARDYDNFVFSFDKKGQFLPLIYWGKGLNKNCSKTFAIPSYVGWNRHDFESITCLGAVNGATVAGIDKSSQQHNWPKLCRYFFNDNNNINIYLNSPSDSTGKTFWYELFPNILFYRIYSFYPDIDGMHQQFITVADKWYEACVAMGGKTEPWAIPDFNHTSFDFKTMKPIDNGIWKEPGSAAAIAWIEYMAYTKTGSEKYLTAAKWAMDFLQNCENNPFYEILLPHGVYTAARMNAEQNTSYDVLKLFRWCFDGSSNRKWGVTTGKWDKYDCSGLVGSIREENPYAFAMNTFNMANSLVPLVKYDERFAKAVGKWMLNASNSARLFYANSLPEYHQTDYMWAQKYDPCSCIAYEGLQKTHTECNRIVEDVETSYGRVVDGSYHDTYFTNNKYQIFEEQNIDGNDKLRHIWKANLTPSNDYKLNVVGKCDSNEAFIISCASTINGPYNPLLKIDSSSVQGLSAPVNSDSSVLFIELEDSAATNSLSKCFIDDVYIISETGSSPYITGDAKSNNWAKTNLGLYGSSFAGIFGGIISKTNVEGILKLNCSATDYFCDNACQTFLFYNPHNSEKKITLQIDNGFKHIYSVLDNTFFYKNVSGKINLVIEKDAPLLIIIIPSSCSISR